MNHYEEVKRVHVGGTKNTKEYTKKCLIHSIRNENLLFSQFFFVNNYS